MTLNHSHANSFYLLNCSRERKRDDVGVKLEEPKLIETRNGPAIETKKKEEENNNNNKEGENLNRFILLYFLIQKILTFCTTSLFTILVVSAS